MRASFVWTAHYLIGAENRFTLGDTRVSGPLGPLQHPLSGVACIRDYTFEIRAIRESIDVLSKAVSVNGNLAVVGSNPGS